MTCHPYNQSSDLLEVETLRLPLVEVRQSHHQAQRDLPIRNCDGLLTLLVHDEETALLSSNQRPLRMRASS